MKYSFKWVILIVVYTLLSSYVSNIYAFTEQEIQQLNDIFGRIIESKIDGRILSLENKIDEKILSLESKIDENRLSLELLKALKVIICWADLVKV